MYVYSLIHQKKMTQILKLIQNNCINKTLYLESN